MAGPTTAHPGLDPRPPGHTARSAVTYAALAIVAIGALWVATRLVAQPSRIARITFVNPTVYDIDIEARGRDAGGGVVVGTAARRTTTTLLEVLDQGSTWVFSFAAQGHEGGELIVERAELEGNEWRVSIPATVGDALRASGAPSPP